MENSSIWMYLDNIWILSGLVLVILVSLLKMLSVNNLNSRKTKQQVQKGMNYLFVLGMTGMALGTLFSQSSNLTALQQADADLFDSPSYPNQDLIDAKSQPIGSDFGTAVSASGSGNFNQLLYSLPDRTRPERPNTLNQQIKDDSGDARNTDEDDFH